MLLGDTAKEWVCSVLNQATTKESLVSGDLGLNTPAHNMNPTMDHCQVRDTVALFFSQPKCRPSTEVWQSTQGQTCLESSSLHTLAKEWHAEQSPQYLPMHTLSSFLLGPLSLPE